MMRSLLSPGSMEPALAAPRIYRFGVFEADVVRNTLTRKGVRVKIQDQPLRVLLMLLERPGEVITREELRQKLWPEGIFVDFDGSLNVILKKLRSALNDNADNPVFIETVPRRGYRFIAPLTLEAPGESRSAPSSLVNVGLASTATSTENRHVSYWRWLGVILALILVAGVWLYRREKAAHVYDARRVIAVLPFSNRGAGTDFDYLRYAIPNELVTSLTHVHALSVRPFASTSNIDPQSLDPTSMGAKLQVTHVVAGAFLLESNELHVNLELIDVARNQSVWTDQITVGPQELIALHDKIAMQAARGLLPAMNISSTSAAEIPSPKNEQALELFQHSLTTPLDPEPNQFAIKKLEESLSLDSSYAPAWGELGWRYYIDYHYGDGGRQAVTKALQAYKRQSELDPDMPPMSTAIRVEQGDLDGAYEQAANLLRRRPDLSLAHYGMSYVLRYAGLLDEAGKECDAALAIDPGFNVFRSCGVVFILTGNYQHAQNFIRLDEHSGYAAMMRVMMALRTGNATAALPDLGVASRGGFRFGDLIRIYLSHKPETELRRAAAELESEPRSLRDPETLYLNAAALSFTGQDDAALRQLSKAIEGNFCSYPALASDPLFSAIRQRPEFAELREAGARCRQNFLAHRTQFAAAARGMIP